MTYETHSENTNSSSISEAYISLWDETEFGDAQLISSSSPTGRMVLEAFNLLPADEYILVQLRDQGIKEIPLDQELDLANTNTNKFFAFHSDRSYKFSIDDKRFSWGADSISEKLLRLIGRVSETEELVLEFKDKADEALKEGEITDLKSENVEHIYSRPRQWKLNVQGVLLTLSSHEIEVREALIQAGFDPNENWTAILKIKGQPKRPIELGDTIDLREPGIEKLRLRPNEIKNGEALNTLRRDFNLLEKDETYLERRNLAWETLIRNRKRWLILRKFSLPNGYDKDSVSIAMDIPDTYPAAAMDMFYCFPSLKLENGRSPDKTDAQIEIEGKQYQRWSRHLNGATRWNPQTDSVISHIAFIEDSFFKEVGE